MAKALDKTADYNDLHKRSFNYKNVFYKEAGIVRGRYAGGAWAESFNPDVREKYITEGTPRQYTFYVPHDVHGLAQLMGGRKALENALDSLFIKDEYWHGNEPGHQIPFMYNYTSSPWKTQQIVREILNREYNDGPGGLSGNDDAGQISAWYIFAAIGFYPVDPVSGNYVLCSPLFDTIRINMPEQKTFEIICHKKNSTDQYIHRITFNGKKYAENYIRYSDLIKGGKFEIWLQAEPASWGADMQSQPPSVTR
jgi:predicted alpha-1,2-mannosidase